jgi:hypothetical protein
MEGLDRLVTESLARHGFDRPPDYRRLHWSPWFRCESPHSLLTVPSKPGVFAIAEEIMPLADAGTNHVGTAEPACDRVSDPVRPSEARLDFASTNTTPNLTRQKRMLAVVQFCEEDDMAFVLDRVFARPNPMRSRLTSGRCFVRYVVLEDESHRRSICAALNQWLISSGERASGIGSHFASSLELPRLEPTPATDLTVRAVASANSDVATKLPQAELEPDARPAVASPPVPAQHLDSGASANLHCPQPLPSGF